MASSLSRRQARRLFLTGLAAAVALAGCQTRGPRPPAPVEPQPDSVAPAPPGSHLVALLVPLTGENGGVSRSIANAANLALLDSGNKSIRLTVYDTGKGGAAAVANQAIAAGNKLILGPLLSEEARAAGAVARRARVPVIAFSNDREAAGDGVYIMGTVPDQAIERVIRLARARGAKRFAALVPVGLYGQRASLAFLGAVQRAGGTVAALQSHAAGPGALRAAVATLNGKGPFDAVLIAEDGRAAAQAAPLLRPGVRILGTELWGNDQSLGRTPALRGAWFAAVPNARFDQLVTRYRGHYGKTPYRLGSLGYDAVLLTVRTARFWEGGAAFPARRLIDREGFAGVDGIFRFGRDGVAERALEVRQVNASGATVVSPAAASFDG